MVLVKFGTQSTENMQNFLIWSLRHSMLAEVCCLKIVTEVPVSIIKYSNTRDILGMILSHHFLCELLQDFFSNLLADLSPFSSALHCQCSPTWCWFSLLILSPELSMAPLMHSTPFSIRLSFPQDVPENTNFRRLIGVIF